MNEDREFYAQLLYSAALHDPHSGIASIILNVAAQLCQIDVIYDAFKCDVELKRSLQKDK